MDVHDRSSQSSPDPLAYSPPTTRSKVPKSSTITRSRSLASQHLSPSKSMLLPESGLSPWRIKVTVEAERDEAEDAIANAKSIHFKGFNTQTSTPGSLAKRRTRGGVVGIKTMTTSVPLKGLDPSPPKKTRGRPRTPAKPKTPGPKSRGKKQTAASIEDMVIDDLVSQGATPSRSAKRSRIKAVNSITDISVENSGTSDDVFSLPAPAKKTRAKRQPKSAVKIAEDMDIADNTLLDAKAAPATERRTRRSASVLSDFQFNRTSSRSGSRSDNNIGVDDTEDLGEDSGDVPRNKFSPAKKTPKKATRDSQIAPPSSNFSVEISKVYPSPSSSGNTDDTLHSQGATVNPEDATIQQNNDPTVRHESHRLRDFDTILESEEFSVISMSSLPSARQNAITPEDSFQQWGPVVIDNAVADMKIHSPPAGSFAQAPSTLASDGESAKEHLTNEGPYKQHKLPGIPELDEDEMSLLKSPAAAAFDGDMSSAEEIEQQIMLEASRHFSPNSSIVSLPAKETPLIDFSPLKFPPPLLQRTEQHLASDLRQPSEAREDSPKLDQAVIAGKALQGLLVPQTRLASPFSSPEKSSKRSCSAEPASGANPFSGFGTGTRRQLRESFRFGEELARRDVEATKASAAMVVSPAAVWDGTSDDVFSEESAGERSTSTTRRSPVAEARGVYRLSLPSDARSFIPEPPASPVQASGTIDHSSVLGDLEFKDTSDNENLWASESEVEGAGIQEDEANTQREFTHAARHEYNDVEMMDVDMMDVDSPIDHSTPTPMAEPTVQDEDVWRAVAQQEESENISSSYIKHRRPEIPGTWRRASQQFVSEEDHSTLGLVAKGEGAEEEVEVEEQGEEEDEEQEEEQEQEQDRNFPVPPEDDDADGLEDPSLLFWHPDTEETPVKNKSSKPLYPTIRSPTFSPLVIPTSSNAGTTAPPSPLDLGSPSQVTFSSTIKPRGPRFSYTEARNKLQAVFEEPADDSELDEAEQSPHGAREEVSQGQEDCSISHTSFLPSPLAQPFKQAATMTLTASQAKKPHPLSGPKWTLSHWRYINTLWTNSASHATARTHSAQSPALPPARSPPAYPSRPRLGALLGTKIWGATSRRYVEMRREEVEVIGRFLDEVEHATGEVGTWDEVFLARILFGLVEGREERRKEELRGVDADVDMDAGKPEQAQAQGWLGGWFSWSGSKQ
ncbi:MAG: hypothetical protein M1829_003919 [Trizodia sp. TS-e1964]|nr:MAG: hypothetical protein M1829_003919 [Trizodia sp. TS-e1964]